jgi:hypothetical protein
MAKKISDQSLISAQGVNLIEQRVLTMGFAWNSTAGTFDVGIDGYIELRDPQTHHALNAIIQVQSKATTRPFTAETSSSFEFLCEDKDIDYWMAGNAPVILVVSRPSTDEAYWVSIKQYFRDLERRRTRKVVFDKARDRFDTDATDALMRMGLSREAGIYFSPPPIEEWLYSNFLGVLQLPPKLYYAESLFKRRHDIGQKLQARNSDAFEWVLRGTRLLSVHDLTGPDWKEIVDAGSVEDFETTEWSETDDADQLSDFTELLGRCLGVRTRQLNLKYSPDQEYYYFPATEDLSPRVVSYKSMRQDADRIVFKKYLTKKSGEAVREYCRHSAFAAQFRRYENEWFLQITPTYRFTSDGERPLRFYESKLKGIKALEKNPTVLGQVVMWADLLREGEPGLFTPPPYPYLQFGDLSRVLVPVGIQDSKWLTGEEEAIQKATSEPLSNLPLFAVNSPYLDDES